MKNNHRLTNAELAEPLLEILKTHTQAGAFFLLALSGGVDSMVLLHALHSLKQTWPFTLHALHVHHGLSQFADDWAKHCQEICQSLDVPLQVVNVQVDRTAKSGIEAEARKLRYQALFAYCDGERVPDFILTAHHEQDQAETLLLQLSRGAGVKGLAGMALFDEKKRMLRPMLAVQKTDMLAYAKKHALNWCEDDSNENTAFERNFLRHEILPIWEKRHPALNKNLARTAAHLAEADALLDTLATMDGEALLRKNSLCLAGLKKLENRRVKNVLRWWLGRFDVAMPNTDYLNEIIAQLFFADSDANVHLNLGELIIKRFGQRAYLLQAAEVKVAVKPLEKKPLEVKPLAFELAPQGETHVSLPNGTLSFKRVKSAGLLLVNPQDKLTIHLRHGGERIKIADNRPARTLKYVMQAAEIPPWARASWPLIYLNNTFACVPNVGVAHHLQTQPDQEGLAVYFQKS